jgi:hypothetical protein
VMVAAGWLDTSGLLGNGIRMSVIAGCFLECYSLYSPHWSPFSLVTVCALN